MSLRLVAACLAILAPAAAFAAENAVRVTLSPADLAAGFDARKVRLVVGDAAPALVVDPRAVLPGDDGRGVVVTDVLDLGPTAGVVALPAEIRRIAVIVEADVPAGGGLTVAARTSPRRFDDAAWSEWVPLAARGGDIARPTGRYVQVRLEMTATAAGGPRVAGVTIESEHGPVAAPPAGLRVIRAAVQRIVRSPIAFTHERPDAPKIARFRAAAGLDAVVAPATTDFDRLVLLMDWAGSCANVRDGRVKARGYYDWDREVNSEVTRPADGRGTPARVIVHGHCMSYAETLVDAATALGYKARHMAVLGFHDMSHEVVEAWVPELRKWVYLDPSLTNYYMARGTNQPLDILELHAAVVGFLPAGRDMDWFVRPDAGDAAAAVHRIGGRTPVDARLGPWSYGSPMPRDYDWGWKHGYLTAGFVQMTPRNDFNSNPAANPKLLSHYPGYAGYPFWVDDRTPPRPGVTNWFTRDRDFHWTLDQATLALAAGPEPGVLVAEFGHSMPFFRGYRVRIDGGPAVAAVSPFTWNVAPGEHTLEVAPIDEFGRIGSASLVVVRGE